MNKILNKHCQTSNLATCLQNIILRIDPRLLVPLCASLGIMAWLLPWQALFIFVPLAVLLLLSALVLLPTGRKAIIAFSSFTLFWSASYFLLQIWEHPSSYLPALQGALIFGGRLFSLLSLSLVVPLSHSSLTIARVLTWYIQRLAILEVAILKMVSKHKPAPKLTEAAWRCGLTLAIMMAFLPRTLRIMNALRKTMRVRMPHAPLSKRLTLLGLAVLRILSTQTWSMTISIASRNLYQPLPWSWRPLTPATKTKQHTD